MNINLGNQGHPQGYSPMTIGQASPYLSPLYGSLSAADKNSPDQFHDFQLQDQPYEPYEAIQGDVVFQEEQINPQLLFGYQNTRKEINSEAFIENQEQGFQKVQIQTPASIINPNHSKIYSVIQFLVMNDSQQENQLLIIGKPLYENSQNLQFVFKTLLGKFKKLRKTKQEMVKYCMRKAFKYTNDQIKSPNKKIKQKEQKNNSTANINVQMPFRKNSSQKTMNIHFLKQVFSNRDFVIGYSKFLQRISQIISEDNNSKILYLSESIEKILAGNQSTMMKEIQNIKRLPWTKSILKRTQELARSLMEFNTVEDWKDWKDGRMRESRECKQGKQIKQARQEKNQRNYMHERLQQESDNCCEESI